ncbi:Nicotinamidase [Amphibalanus amphitrite]|uniref:nicotinamidase n=1 Tax=Amphibalanus amphitrite TaxID=1232801 RepID=A0A6A4WBY6_AMPAM|nr:Nicotinamidase [Amphibalanus amphitrite]KAF0303866.1 Nicotinamidase [Amphibalanus amphitrite]
MAEDCSEFFNRSDGHATLENGMDACLQAFDLDSDGKLSVDEFGALCRALFRDETGAPYPLEIKKLACMFSVFDTNQDGFIDSAEFQTCWSKWITPILRPITAFVIVDVQNDFISGSLAVCNCPAGHKGEEVVPVINSVLDSVKFDVVVYSLDWHPSDHISFVTNVANFPMHSSSKVSAEEAKVLDTVVFDSPVREQTLWPPHCIQESWGAQLHPDLKVMDEALTIKKGCNREIESYSAFFDNARESSTGLSEQLKQRFVTDVIVCGLATDVCVAATAMDALSEGFRTTVLEDACRGVNAEDIEKKKCAVAEQHGLVVDSAKAGAIAAGRDRPPELAYKLALDLAKN